MHGYLRFDRKAGEQTKEAADSVVLVEQDYFDFFNDPISLFNYTFLYLLREYPCVFVGLSMQDENIRRLLHFSKLERLRAFEAEGKKEKNVRDKLIRHFAILLRHARSRVDEAIEDSLDPLGTKVLWIDSFAEIPARLADMYNAAGDDWARVF